LNDDEEKELVGSSMNRDRWHASTSFTWTVGWTRSFFFRFYCVIWLDLILMNIKKKKATTLKTWDIGRTKKRTMCSQENITQGYQN